MARGSTACRQQEQDAEHGGGGDPDRRTGRDGRGCAGTKIQHGDPRRGSVQAGGGTDLGRKVDGRVCPVHGLQPRNTSRAGPRRAPTKMEIGCAPRDTADGRADPQANGWPPACGGRPVAGGIRWQRRQEADVPLRLGRDDRATPDRHHSEGLWLDQQLRTEASGTAQNPKSGVVVVIRCMAPRTRAGHGGGARRAPGRLRPGAEKRLMAAVAEEREAQRERGMRVSEMSELPDSTADSGQQRGQRRAVDVGEGGTVMPGGQEVKGSSRGIRNGRSRPSRWRRRRPAIARQAERRAPRRGRAAGLGRLGVPGGAAAARRGRDAAPAGIGAAGPMAAGCRGGRGGGSDVCS